MRLTGEDVWAVGLKMGWARGAYNPAKNPTAARATEMATLLNEILRDRADWLGFLTNVETALKSTTI